VSWISLRITPASNRDGVIAALFESGSQGIQEDGPAVVTHFPPDARIGDIRDAVMTADPRADIAVSEAPEADYSQWRASVSAHHVGNLVIAPPWLADDFDREVAATPELDGTVGRVYQVGYTFRGQLLRPARVVVRQYTLAD